MKLHQIKTTPNPSLVRRGTSSAFTLVELIVVITILAILGTIAFVSLQGYSRDSRNSVRITDIKTTETALELYSLQTGKYPLPDNYEVVTTTGAIDLWNKGEFDTDLLRKLDRLSDLPKDPKTEELMGYSTTLQQKEYELKYNLEISNNSNINQTHAISSNSYVKGNYNGLFVVGRNNAYYSTPGLFSDITDVTSTGTFDLHQLQTQYQVEGLTNSGTLITLSNIDNNQKEFAIALKAQYADNTDLNSGIYEVLANLEVTNTGQLTKFTQAITSGDISSLIVAASNEEVITPVANYSIGNSLLLDGSSEYLSRTPTTAGNTQTFTISSWVKRSGLTSLYSPIMTADLNGSQSNGIYYLNSGALDIRLTWGGSSWTGYFVTNELFNDTTDWHHVVLSVDTTQAIETDRVKIFVDGNPITSFSSHAYPPQHTSTAFNLTRTHEIGKLTGSSYYYDGYVSDMNFIDGQALAATDFAEDISGTWTPKTFSGPWNIDYNSITGINGFHLDFSDATYLGKDIKDETQNALTFTGTFTTNSTNILDYNTSTFATGVGTASYGGIYFSSAIQLKYVKFYSGSNGKFSSDLSSNPNTYTLYAKNGVPTNATDGTALQSIVSTNGQASVAFDSFTSGLYTHYWLSQSITATTGYLGEIEYSTLVTGPNHWNTSGTPSSTSDTPTSNYATLDNLVPGLSSTLSEGNTRGTLPPTNGVVISNIPLPTTGKWYSEAYFNSAPGYAIIGIGRDNMKGWNSSQEPSADSLAWATAIADFSIVGNVSISNSSLTGNFGTGEWVGVGWDADTKTVSIVTASGTSTTTAGGTFLNSAITFIFGASSASATGDVIVNHGADPWHIAPPDNDYKALTTQNIP